jgi:hypothetical protein
VEVKQVDQLPIGIPVEMQTEDKGLFTKKSAS